MRIAEELDPLAPILPSAIGYGLIVAGKFDEAVDELKKGIELAPTLGLHHAMLGTAYMMSRRYREVTAALETAARLEPELAIRQGYLAYVYSRSGQMDRAREIVARLSASRATGRKPAVALAVAQIGMRDWDGALTSLEEAVRIHDIGLLTASSVVLDPLYDPIRSSPRFENILREMNLLEYVNSR